MITNCKTWSMDTGIITDKDLLLRKSCLEFDKIRFIYLKIEILKI